MLLSSSRLMLSIFFTNLKKSTICQDKEMQGKAKEDMEYKGTARQGKARQGKARQGKARQGERGKARQLQGKARPGNARQGQARRLTRHNAERGRRRTRWVTTPSSPRRPCASDWYT